MKIYGGIAATEPDGNNSTSLNSRRKKMAQGKIWFAVILFSLGIARIQGQDPGSGVNSESPRSLPEIHSRAEFDSLAVDYDPNTPYALPHVLFVIDRKDKNRIYYVNTRRYPFHKDFVNGTYLSLERGQEFFENNYLKPNRRFIMGTIAYQTPVRRWTLEFWEGDLIAGDQIELASDVVNQTFFTPVAFKPNSLRQEEASANIEGLKRVLQTEISKSQEYQALNVEEGDTCNERRVRYKAGNIN